MQRKRKPAGNRRRGAEVAGLLSIIAGVIALLSLVSYSAGDSTWFHQRPDVEITQNWIGPVGAIVAEALLQLFGTTAVLAPLLLVWLGWSILRGRRTQGPSLARVAAYGVLALALCSLLDLLYGSIAYDGERFPAGGYVGRRAAGALRAMLNAPGALLVSATVLASAVILTTRFSFVRSVELLTDLTRRAWTAGRERAVREWQAWRDYAARRAANRAAARARAAASVPQGPLTTPSKPAAPRPASIRLDVAPAPAAKAPPVLSAKLAPPASPASPKKPAKSRQTALPIEPGARGYSLPPLELLNEAEPQVIESEQELLERARLITDKLQEFAVTGEVVAIHPGPVVTTFEFRPEAGIKYSKVTGMTDDLSLALRAESVRIDRMAGRSTIGIEVPNRRQETIFPRELFASAKFRDSESLLTLALGKDISGDVAIARLERMPHLLIAGATGAGKSVGLNGMITSVLYKAKPDQVRFIMIDTKMIELGIYADIPHLLVPVVTEAKHAAAALKWAVREMEQRYRKLAAVGVRNVAQFNRLLEDEPGRTMNDPKTGEPVELKALPFIVIVIDELADLMMVASSDVEEAIMRLAQMARAVGIHLIIATQRPSVDVITGTIKANFPSRIAYRVSQRVDSRTIIDQQGAEHLLGRGDMLYLSSGSSRLTRVHGGLITEPELHRIVSFLKKMAEPVYDETVLSDADEEAGAVHEAERDEMYVKAVRAILQEGKCSVTLIQRRLQLGYARAARIVDMMEREGVVSVGEGSKPREVLVGPEFLETIESQPF